MLREVMILRFKWPNNAIKSLKDTGFVHGVLLLNLSRNNFVLFTNGGFEITWAKNDKLVATRCKVAYLLVLDNLK